MKNRLATLCLLLACAGTTFAQKTTPAITAADLRARLNILASDSLAGRRTGEPGCDKAARYIAGEFKRFGLEVLDPTQTYLQEYEFSEHQFDSTKTTPTKAANVVGFLKGSDKNLSREVVIIGAHYDHLGMGGHNALDTVKSFHYGADDNASGTAGMLELAEYFSKHRKELKRSVIFIGFSGEEEGLFGSANYVKHPLYSLDQTQAMINMDMIGRLKDSVLIVEGMGTSPEWKKIVDPSLTKKLPIAFHLKPDGEGPSDHASFYRKNIPVLFFFTGLHKDYHKASDTRDKINYNGEEQVLSIIKKIVVKTANLATRLPYTIVPIDTSKKTTTFHAYVGGVPDYGYDGEGLKISDITPGSPAAAAGLKAEDIVIQFGDMQIKNIYDYTKALSKHNAGETVLFTVKRGRDTVALNVTLGNRPAH
ncbi:MAG: M28 family peptidase [Bacteroidetes bacterium]|nr:M28 family peptidase [Bacteroidota bacterium]